MDTWNRFRSIALITITLPLLSSLAHASAAETFNPVLLEPGGGRILSLTGAIDPLKTTGMPTGMSQQPGARFEPVRDNCLIQPPQMDLRLIWMRSTDDGYEVTLRYFVPFRFLEELYDQPVKHTLSLIFTPPTGDSVTVSVGRSERLAMKRGKEKLRAVGADFSIIFTDVIFRLPSTLEIGDDWVLTTRSRVVGDADFCPDPNFPNRYFEVNTTPVRVSSLTGEGEQGFVSALPQGMAFESVFHEEYKAIEWKPQPMPDGTRLESLSLEEANGHVIAVLTMDTPFAFPANTDGQPPAILFSVGLDLVEPGYLGINHPYSVRIDLFVNGPVTQAFVWAPLLRSQGGMSAIGTVPVELSGDQVRFDLTALSPIDTPYVSPPFATGDDSIAELGTIAFTIEGTLTSEDDSVGADSEPFTLEVVGPALRFTFADGSVSTGWLDPYDNHFIADGPLVAGGLGANDSKQKCVQSLGERIRRLQDMSLSREVLRVQKEIDAALASDDLTYEKLHRLLDNQFQLHQMVKKRLKEEESKAKAIKATGCEDSPQPTSVEFTSVRAFDDTNAVLTRPDWLAPLPELYWDLGEIGIQAIGFGNASPAPFPFESHTEWTPAEWNLTPKHTGWAIRAWSQVVVPTSDGNGTIAPTSLTPYVAASLISSSAGNAKATPIAIGLPGQAVFSVSTRIRRRSRRGRKFRQRSSREYDLLQTCRGRSAGSA